MATFDGTAAIDEPTEQYVYHAAGLGGNGSGSYIDAVILRDRDTTGGSPHTLDERVYYLQNWRADVVALVSDAAAQLQQVRYSAYAVPFNLPAGDVLSAYGQANFTDDSQIATWYGGSTYDVRGDLDLDGDVDATDVGLFVTNNNGGRGVLSLAGNDSRKGYAGYEIDPDLTLAKWHVRNRVLDSEAGRWISRPLPINTMHVGNLIDGNVRGVWTNITFFLHYVYGNGATINLANVGLDAAYLSHAAVVGTIAIIYDDIKTVVRPQAEPLARGLECGDCDAPQSDESTLTGTVTKNVSRAAFVQQNPILFWVTLSSGHRVPFINPLWFSDWTFSIGGHNIRATYTCGIGAECGPVINTAIWGYTCNVSFLMTDVYTDQLSLNNNATFRALNLYLAANGYPTIPVDPPGATPYTIRLSWSGSLGETGSVFNQWERPLCGLY